MFVGAVAGISTLSADARSVVSPDSVAVSLYKPENGPALNLFGGANVHEYVTIQGNYVWNRNDLVLSSGVFGDTRRTFDEQPHASSQHAAVADVLVYFRERRSRVRPYLSVGLGIVRFAGRATASAGTRGAARPPVSFAATGALLRVAVGLDVGVSGRWRFRYSFSESISHNPVSAELSPPGQRNLANFQNLFGFLVSL